MAVALGALLSSIAAPCEGQGESVSVGDARIYFEVAGRDTPVVLIHGWANDLRAWDDQFAVLAKNFRVIRYDRRGFGRSTSVGDLTADPVDLAALLDTLGVSSAHVVGHSAGARVALAFALAFPDRVRGLVLYSSGPPQGFPITADAAAFASLPVVARRVGLDSLGKLVMSMPAFHIPPQRDDVRRRVGALWSAYSGRDVLEEHAPSGKTPLAALNQLGQIRAPTLIVVGDADGAFFHQIADSLAARIAGARRETIRGGGHVVHMLAPARFNAAVEAFLRSVERP
jgi:pimeloyl-ACP methyl ester carboxylesterase